MIPIIFFVSYMIFTKEYNENPIVFFLIISFVSLLLSSFIFISLYSFDIFCCKYHNIINNNQKFNDTQFRNSVITKKNTEKIIINNNNNELDIKRTYSTRIKINNYFPDSNKIEQLEYKRTKSFP
jgi:hypothetical protein